jgi:hypothetical protein
MSASQFVSNLWARVSDNTCWVYIHLPKTAGSSLSSVLRQHFGGRRIGGVSIFDVSDKERSLEYLARHRFRLIGGHLGRLQVEQLEAAWPKIKFRYFTFLRDPASRLISAYRHGLKIFHTLPKPELINAESEPGLLSGTYNTQARQLAYGYDFLDTPKDASDNLIFSRAMETIDRCEFFGFYENLDSDLQRLCSLIGIRKAVVLPTLKSTTDVKFQFDANDHRQAEILTRLDLAVYRESLARRAASG